MRVSGRQTLMSSESAPSAQELDSTLRLIPQISCRFKVSLPHLKRLPLPTSSTGKSICFLPWLCRLHAGRPPLPLALMHLVTRSLAVGSLMSPDQMASSTTQLCRAQPLRELKPGTRPRPPPRSLQRTLLSAPSRARFPESPRLRLTFGWQSGSRQPSKRDSEHSVTQPRKQQSKR